MKTESTNAKSLVTDVSGSVTDSKPKFVIIGGGESETIGMAVAKIIAESEKIEIVASVQDVKNQMGNDYFARESLKLKCFSEPPLIQLTDKKGKPFDTPKSKYHR